MKNWLTRTLAALRSYWPELAVAMLVPGGSVFALLLLLRPRNRDGV